jgi:hypothetical protein
MWVGEWSRPAAHLSADAAAAAAAAAAVPCVLFLFKLEYLPKYIKIMLVHSDF